MPPKDASKTKLADGGKESVVTAGSKGGTGTVPHGFGPTTEAQRTLAATAPPPAGVVPALNDGDKSTHGDGPGGDSSASSVAGPGLEDFEMEDASLKAKVSRVADKVEKLFYTYGNQFMQATQDVIGQAPGIDASSAKAMNASWNEVRKQIQPQLNQCLIKLVDSVPDGFEVPLGQEAAHPAVRPVAFRDLVENARADIVGSLEELVKWMVTNAQDPATLQSLAGLKQEAHTQVYDTVLSKMSRDILDRMADAGSAQVDFGRDSDYGQALQAQQTLAKEKDDLQLQLERFQKQVDDLKASEADLNDKCTEWRNKLFQAQAELMASRDKVGILDAVTSLLATDTVTVVSNLVAKRKQHDSLVDTIGKLKDKIAELDSHVCPTNSAVLQDDSARVQDLERQLRAVQDANVNLQKLVADQQKQIASGSGGKTGGEAKVTGHFKVPSHSSSAPETSASSSIPPETFSSDPRVVKASTSPDPTAMTAGTDSDPITIRDVLEIVTRNQSVPAPPPLKVFLGEYKEDKMGLSEFLKMYKHRYGLCAEDVKVGMLGEYLAGEAKRVYRSILSSWDGKSGIPFIGLESRMKNLMLDNSQRGMLLKQQRVHGLRMNQDESYLSFITFLETKVCEAYDDESYSIVDGVKIQVLLKNIRDPTLALQVEQALRNVPMGSPLFPTAKDLVIAYERTAKQARQWAGNAGSGSNLNHSKGSGRGKFQGSPASQEKSDIQPADINASAAPPAEDNSISAPPRSVPVCFNCRKPGHLKADCRSGGAPQLTGGNAAPAKFGNRGPIVCHEMR